MQYPLNLRFKIIALANQIQVTDSAGNELFYVKQKLFKLKENIEIYSNSNKTTLLYTIKADRVIDFSAAYTLTDAQGKTLGSVKRRGARSILKASYDIEVGGNALAHVREVNPWAKLGDALFGELPLIGLLSGYVFHPRYTVEAADGSALALLKKEPAFLEGKYVIENEKLDSLDEQTQNSVVLLLMMVTLLERLRG